MNVLYLYPFAFGLLWVVAIAVELGLAMYSTYETRPTLLKAIPQIFIAVSWTAPLATPGLWLMWWSVSHLSAAA